MRMYTAVQAKRQYLPTFQESRYYISAYKSSVI